MYGGQQSQTAVGRVYSRFSTFGQTVRKYTTHEGCTASVLDGVRRVADRSGLQGSQRCTEVEQDRSSVLLVQLPVALLGAQPAYIYTTYI